MWNLAWSRDRRRGGWAVALVATALVALLLGVCDSGGHHRVALPDRVTTASALTASGCPDRDLPCAHAHDEHVAAPVPELRAPGAPAEGDAGAPVVRPAAASGAAAAYASAAPPALDSGRALLRKVCVTRT
ncbi:MULTISPECIES: hypothetical protein [unclassified Streptomyces]|uniref:hypothetical protein n=1 Tax=unclassified Streptomyces TaxID=2593676 RepID=UPI0004CA44F4|nr:hypothetical protein [Streptomyces sp. NRRL F-2747]